jgi:hypothetical protein
MRRMPLALAILSVIAIPASAPAKPAEVVHCTKVSYGTNSGYNQYVSSNVRGRRASCAVARKVAHVDPAKITGTGSETRKVSSHKFACRGKAHTDSAGRETVAFRCTRGKATVWFTWAPQ